MSLFIIALRQASVPANVQRAAWALACQEGDEDTREVLVRRDDAPADLVEVYRNLTEATLRVAFLTRRMSTEELTAEVKREKRAGVLAAVVGEVDAEGLTAVEKVFLLKPTRVLAEALVKRSNGLTGLKIIEALDPKVDTASSVAQGSFEDGLRRVLTVSPDLTSQAVVVLASVCSSRVLLELTTTSAERVVLLGRLLASAQQAPTGRWRDYQAKGYERRNTLRALDAEIRSSSEGEDLAALVAATLASGTWSSEEAATLAVLRSQALSGETLDLTTSAGLLHAARTATDPDVLGTVLAKAVTGGKEEVLGCVALNAATRRDDVLKALDALRSGSLTKLLSVRDTCALLERWNDDELRDATLLAARRPHDVGLDHYQDARVAALRLLGACAANRSGVTNVRMVMALAAEADLSDEVVLGLVSMHDLGASGLGTKLMERWLRRVDAVLGDDDRLWESMASLAEGFVGTPEELLSTVTLLG